MSTVAQSINLASVNTHPDRAKRVIGAVIEGVKDRYPLVHAGNSTTIVGVEQLLRSIQPAPGVLFCASMWTPEEQAKVLEIAKTTIPGIRTYAIPTGLHAQVGPDGVVEHLVERIDEIMK